MNSKLNNITAMLLATLIFGCATRPMSESERLTQMELHERQELIASFRSQFEKVHENIGKGRIDEAEVYLKSLRDNDFEKMGLPQFAMEYEMLEKTIKEARELFDLKTANSVTEKRFLQEVDEKIALPDTYGKTVIIDAKLPPPEIPEGKMEGVINKNVSISLDNAGIAELVGALREICKLNVIADDAIQEDKKLTIAVEDAPLQEILTYISRNMGIAFHLGQNVVWITKSAATSGGPLLETQMIRLRQGLIPKVPQGGPGAPGAKDGGAGSVEVVEDTELEEALAAVLSDSPDGATYKIFRDRNILLIRDTRENIRLAEKVINEFDKPPQQVVIEARFVTISQDDLKDIGAEITQKNQVAYHDPSNHAKVKSVNMLTSLAALGNGAPEVGLVNFSGVLENRTFDILISAINKKESTVTLSVPRVTVMNNRQARFRKGHKLFYFEEYDLKTVDNKTTNLIGNTSTWTENVLVPTGSPTELPIGLTFDVNVNIGNDGKTVMLGLRPEIVEFEDWEEYITGGSDSDSSSSSSSSSSDSGLSQIKLPRTYEKSVVTTVAVASGQTVVLGGMLEKNKNKTVRKIPLLGDLPLVGYLFRHEEFTQKPVNLLMFITATVINDRGEYVLVQEPEEAK